MNTAWQTLTAELDRWQNADRTATLWWRDDDAIADSPALNRLLHLAGGRPIALAVIPKRLEQSLASRLATEPDVGVLPHGVSHTNHEPPNRKKAEFGAARDPATALPEIAAAAKTLAKVFPNAYRPIFVPPWNRIAPAIEVGLPAIGMKSVSGFGDRPSGNGEHRLNTHVDILDWNEKKRSGNTRFVGIDTALGVLAEAFAHRRCRGTGTDPLEPVGLLTHHLEHDSPTWDFLEHLLSLIDDHPAARWIAVEDGLRW